MMRKQVSKERELRIGGLTPMTTIDYPGELAAVVFCQGCPWRCRYCHNPGLLPGRGGNELSWSRVLDFLDDRRGLLDAVVFSGGEPTTQSALAPAVRQVRELGFKVGLHSAGSYPDRLQQVLPHVDWVGLDIKALPEDYPAVTGVAGSGTAAWESARRLSASGVEHEIRITVHPQLLSPARLRTLIRRIEGLGAGRIVLQPYRKDVSLDRALTAFPPAEQSAYLAQVRLSSAVSVRA